MNPQDQQNGEAYPPSDPQQAGLSPEFSQFVQGLNWNDVGADKIQKLQLEKVKLLNGKSAGDLAGSNALLKYYQNQAGGDSYVHRFLRGLAAQDFSHIVQPKNQINNLGGAIGGFAGSLGKSYSANDAARQAIGKHIAEIQAKRDAAQAIQAQNERAAGMLDPAAAQRGIVQDKQNKAKMTNFFNQAKAQEHEKSQERGFENANQRQEAGFKNAATARHENYAHGDAAAATREQGMENRQKSAFTHGDAAAAARSAEQEKLLGIRNQNAATATTAKNTEQEKLQGIKDEAAMKRKTTPSGTQKGAALPKAPSMSELMKYEASLKKKMEPLDAKKPYGNTDRFGDKRTKEEEDQLKALKETHAKLEKQMADKATNAAQGGAIGSPTPTPTPGPGQNTTTAPSGAVYRTNPDGSRTRIQ